MNFDEAVFKEERGVGIGIVERDESGQYVETLAAREASCLVCTVFAMFRDCMYWKVSLHRWWRQSKDNLVWTLSELFGRH